MFELRTFARTETGACDHDSSGDEVLETEGVDVIASSPPEADQLSSPAIRDDLPSMGGLDRKVVGQNLDDPSAEERDDVAIGMQVLKLFANTSGEPPRRAKSSNAVDAQYLHVLLDSARRVRLELEEAFAELNREMAQLKRNVWVASAHSTDQQETIQYMPRHIADARAIFFSSTENSRQLDFLKAVRSWCGFYLRTTRTNRSNVHVGMVLLAFLGELQWSSLHVGSGKFEELRQNGEELMEKAYGKYVDASIVHDGTTRLEWYFAKTMEILARHEVEHAWMDQDVVYDGTLALLRAALSSATKSAGRRLPTWTIAVLETFASSSCGAATTAPFDRCTSLRAETSCSIVQRRRIAREGTPRRQRPFSRR